MGNCYKSNHTLLFHSEIQVLRLGDMINCPGFPLICSKFGTKFCTFHFLWQKTLHVQSFQHSICFPIGYNRMRRFTSGCCVKDLWANTFVLKVYIFWEVKTSIPVLSHCEKYPILWWCFFPHIRCLKRLGSLCKIASNWFVK